MFVFVMVYLMPKLKTNFKIRGKLEDEFLSQVSNSSVLPIIKRILQN